MTELPGYVLESSLREGGEFTVHRGRRHTDSCPVLVVGFIHKDLHPANILVDDADNVRLTGFGIASRLPRERQAPLTPEVVAGTLPYMACPSRPPIRWDGCTATSRDSRCRSASG